MYLFLRDKLSLPINKAKSGIRRPKYFEVLGYTFTPVYQKGVKGKYQLISSKKSWGKLKRKLKQVTKKTLPYSFDERILKLKQVYRGWLNHFRLGSIQIKLKKIDEWLRNRLRYCIWHDSEGFPLRKYPVDIFRKEPACVEVRKRKNLIRLGVSNGKAYAFSRTRKGGWAVAQSPILTTTITISRLKKRGYESLTDYYSKVKYCFDEPLYTRSVRTVV